MQYSTRLAKRLGSQGSLLMRYIVLITLIIIGCAGCEAARSTSLTVTSRAESTDSPEATVTAEADDRPASPSLLVSLTSQSARQIALIDGDGTVFPLLDLPGSASRVTGCGDEATSPDGRYYAFYAGGSAGSLYLMDAVNPPVLVDDVAQLVCLGNGTFQFAPDSQNFAYIDYPTSATDREYAVGTLRLFSAETAAEITSFENVTAFDLNDDGAVVVRFFTNNRAEADEAAITLWDGSSDREVVTLLPTDERCRFTSASVSAAPDKNTVGLVLGQRCTSGNPATQWQFYLIDLTDSSATFAAREYQPGAFVPFARTNNIFFSPDSTHAFFTVPDGVTVSTATLAMADLSDMTISTSVERQMVLPGIIGSANAAPRISPDGRWLAMVVTSPDNDNQIVAISLAEPAMPPIAISAGSRGDAISGLKFTRDSQQVVYIAGATQGGDNALLLLNLALGSERRVVRGHFDSAIAVSPDGTAVALLDWQQVEQPRQPMYTNLVLYDLATSAGTTLFTGADVLAGEVANLRTAVPLTWR